MASMENGARLHQLPDRSAKQRCDGRDVQQRHCQRQGYRDGWQQRQLPHWEPDNLAYGRSHRIWNHIDHSHHRGRLDYEREAEDDGGDYHQG